MIGIFNIAVEYQSMHALNPKSQFLPFIYGLLAVSMFTAVPPKLYIFSLTIQEQIAKALSASYGNTASVAKLISQAINQISGRTVIEELFFLIMLLYSVIKTLIDNIKRGGILLIQICVGSLYMFGIPTGHIDGIKAWMKQIFALCFTAFLQTTIMYLGLISYSANMILGIGVMLAAGETPRICQQFGLDTSAKSNFQTASNVARTVITTAKTVASFAA